MAELIQTRLFAWSENSLSRWLIYAVAVATFGMLLFRVMLPTTSHTTTTQNPLSR